MKPKLLWADDNAAIRSGINYALGDVYQIDFATSAQKAIQAITSAYGSPNEYDLVVLDYDLGDNTGAYVAQQMRDRNIETTILFHTARSQKDVLSAVFDLPDVHYMAKGQRKKTLVNRINGLL